MSGATTHLRQFVGCSAAARSATFFMLLATAPLIHAADICVLAGDAAGLKAALATAASNGEDDLIRLQAGDYDLPSNFSLFYYPNTEQHNLEISGGYSGTLGSPCGIATTLDASKTVIHGGTTGLFLPEGTGSILVEKITFRDAFSSSQVPIVIAGAGTSTGSIQVKHSMFLGNTSTTNAAVVFGAFDGLLSIENSVFASNASLGGVSSVALSTSHSNGGCLNISGSTFAKNTSTASSVTIDAQHCSTFVTNTIFWGTPGFQAVDLASPATTTFQNDDVFDVDDLIGAQSLAVLSVDPLFNADLSLGDFSPLRNRGIDYVGADTDFDITGSPRVYGAHVDIGAFEIQDVIFASGVDVQLPAGP